MASNALSPGTIEIVKASAPVLAEHGAAIAGAMYRNMFADHPEVRPFFNAANQSSGADKTRASQIEAFSHEVFDDGDDGDDGAASSAQQATLAQAVYAYAANIDNLEALLPAVQRITHKHASLGIRAEHYPIVGGHILGAIKEVLGDAATDELLGAWEEAYGFLANLLIGIESGLVEESAATPGGWRGFRPFVVDRKVKESNDVYSFYLKPQDGGAIAPFSPGQYTCFRLSIPGYDWSPGSVVHRNYTLSGPAEADTYRVSIKREASAGGHPHGVCSNHFHDHIGEGDVVEMAHPYGDLALAHVAQHPQVFICAGIGTTAMYALLQGAVASGTQQPLRFVQCVRDGRHHPLRDEVRQVAADNANVAVHVCYSRPGTEDQAGKDYDTAGRVNAEVLKTLLPGDDCELYFTGPIPFMHDVYAAMRELGVPNERIHYECYGPFSLDVES